MIYLLLKNVPTVKNVKDNENKIVNNIGESIQLLFTNVLKYHIYIDIIAVTIRIKIKHIKIGTTTILFDKLFYFIKFFESISDWDLSYQSE